VGRREEFRVAAVYILYEGDQSHRIVDDNRAISTEMDLVYLIFYFFFFLLYNCEVTHKSNDHVYTK
jgi:hypothetical protein